jgi:hypothetical protein
MVMNELELTNETQIAGRLRHHKLRKAPYLVWPSNKHYANVWISAGNSHRRRATSTTTCRDYTLTSRVLQREKACSRNDYRHTATVVYRVILCRVLPCRPPATFDNTPTIKRRLLSIEFGTSFRKLQSRRIQAISQEDC